MRGATRSSEVLGHLSTTQPCCTDFCRTEFWLMYFQISVWIPDHSATAAHRGRWHADLQPPWGEKEEPDDQKNCQHQTDSAGAGQWQESP